MHDAPPVATCESEADGWRCEVTLAGDGRPYEVTLDRATLDELAPGASPEALVEASFRFLLEREPPEAILRSFDLPVIGRYFPEYPREISRRLRNGDPRPPPARR